MQAGKVIGACLSCLILLLLLTAPAVAGPPDQAGQTYVVQAGDTLSGIALRFGVSIEALISANQIPDPNLIQVGQELRIPTPEVQKEIIPSSLPDEAGVHAAHTAPTSQPQVYIVQPGDTLYRIATRFGVAVEELVEANHLSDPNYLQVGQALRIPGTEFPTFYPPPFHQVQIGPLPIAQGQTLLVRVILQAPAALSGEFDGRPLHFLITDWGGWTLIGIHALQSIGVYSLVLHARPRHGEEVTLTLPVRVRSGDYATEDIFLPPERRALLDPKLVAAEEARMKAVYAQLSPYPLWEGLFRMPVQEERVTSPFGTRRSYNGGPVSGFHTGIDLGGEEGTPVYAPARGRIALSETLAVRGNVVVIDHGFGVFSGFFHLSQLRVQHGQMVEAGDLIGYIGNTGLSSGPHLHWEMRVFGTAVDPLQWTKTAFPTEVLSSP
ncbi:MAG: LysM peptidoglycan-binding domain-containing protein [Anaerolineae bacterium]|nr:LysM peptidoglycan-binding domain-containing protein [Anaerolineae bacterium]MDW8070625.1 LysM peptidoglycan-binding domain-containing protein [Anaerolineae bacterium]